MNFTLPTTVEAGGETFAVRTDFRVILEILLMLQDGDLSEADKAEALLTMFYLEPETVTDKKAAVQACFGFIDHSDRPAKKAPRVMDWEQDWDAIIAPVNRVLGYEARSVPYDPITNTGGVHWWTFQAAFMEIGGDCLFAQIVSIRDKVARRKKLEKFEREWWRRNPELIQLRQRYTDSEESLLSEWT